MDLTSFISSLDETVKGASLGIVLLAGVAWMATNPKIGAAKQQLSQLRRHFDGYENPGRQAIADAVQKTNNVNIRAVLAEVQSGIFELPGDLGTKSYSLRPFQELWTPRALLYRQVNLSLYEAAPNILIGVGLLFTWRCQEPSATPGLMN
jgi:hypothetical protein